MGFAAPKTASNFPTAVCKARRPGSSNLPMVGRGTGPMARLFTGALTQFSNGEGEIRTPEWGYPHCWFSKPVRSTALAPLQVPDRSPPGGNIQICGDGFSRNTCQFIENLHRAAQIQYNEIAPLYRFLTVRCTPFPNSSDDHSILKRSSTSSVACTGCRVACERCLARRGGDGGANSPTSGTDTTGGNPLPG